MSIGSCDEIRVLIDFARDLGFISSGMHKEVYEQYDEIGKMLNSLHKKWE